MSWYLTNLIAAFLLPPLNLMLAALIGLAVRRAHPRTGRALIAGSLLLLWICATPYFAGTAMKFLEGVPHPVNAAAAPADAIVVLGGGTYFDAPEYGGTDTVSAPSLVRLRYAAKLQRETGKPLLVAGGAPAGNTVPEAALMQAVLENEFRVPVRWTEDTSANTYENARNSYAILHKAGIRRIYLVTHAWHMPRAARAFEAAGFEVVPAPTAYSTRRKTDFLSFMPNAESLEASRVFAHELIGNLWYRLKSQP